ADIWSIPSASPSRPSPSTWACSAPSAWSPSAAAVDAASIDSTPGNSNPCTIGSKCTSASGVISSIESRSGPSARPANLVNKTNQTRRIDAMPTTTTNADQTIQSMQITKDEMIEAPIEIVFQAMLDELGPESQMPGGKPLPF